MTMVERLSRYRDFAALLAKYGRTDFSTQEATDLATSRVDAEAFVRDVEALAPTFIKLGQLLSTRADFVAAPYVAALERLQDSVEPFSFEEATAIVAEESLAERTEDFDPLQMKRVVTDLVGRYKDAPANGDTVGTVILDLARSGGTCGVRAAPELALLGKTLPYLGEIGRSLDPTFDHNAALREDAPRLMQRRMLKAVAPSHVFSTALELRVLVEKLPGHLNRMLDALSGTMCA